MQKYCVGVKGSVLFFDVGGKHNAIAAVMPFHPEQRPVEVLHDAHDLNLFVRQVNFAGPRIPYKCV
jgi:hypothetical protein